MIFNNGLMAFRKQVAIIVLLIAEENVRYQFRYTFFRFVGL